LVLIFKAFEMGRSHGFSLFFYAQQEHPQVHPLPGQLSPQPQIGVALVASAQLHFLMMVSIVLYLIMNE
jgi:hypothetical protein